MPKSGKSIESMSLRYHELNEKRTISTSSNNGFAWKRLDLARGRKSFTSSFTAIVITVIIITSQLEGSGACNR